MQVIVSVYVELDVSVFLRWISMDLKVNIRQLCILTSSCSARDVTASPWLRCANNFSNSFQPANAMIQISCNESFYIFLCFWKKKWWKKWWKTHFSTTNYGPLVRSFNALQPPSSRIWFKRHLGQTRRSKTRDQRSLTVLATCQGNPRHFPLDRSWSAVNKACSSPLLENP